MIWGYALLSVFIVSLISLIGIFTISLKAERLEKVLIYLISFSAGALFGDAFIHLLPEIVEEVGFTLEVSLYLLFGIILFFIIEKIIHWNHCHMPITDSHVHSYSIMNLVGDGTHNLIDGLIIGGSYLISIPVGIATTIAVLLHEIPQEISDFGVLIHGGFSRNKALFYNFLTALISFVGVIIALSLGKYFSGLSILISSLAVGGFIYIAGSDLIPELHKETSVKKSFLQLISFVLGILVMYGLLFLE